MGKPKRQSGCRAMSSSNSSGYNRWMQEHRGSKVYPYQVIGELCQRWLDKHGDE